MSALQTTLFDEEAPVSSPAVAAKEPLYSLLVTSPSESILFLYNNLIDYKDDSQLEDEFSNVGLTRREFIEQVMIALRHRGML